MNTKRADDQYSEQETIARRDAVIKHMLGKPPKPRSEMKLGKQREKRGIKSRANAKSI
ncbi:MAG: hypothetical protein M3178_05405 [Pseudomonadota bacterium]|nr:hypothetical protein [Pseudomonadota bacterium]